MSDPVLIRPFTMQDYEAVFGLWATAGTGVTLRPSDQPGEVQKKLTRDPDLFLVAEEDGRVVGVIIGAWDGRRGWLHHLAVHPAYRRQGIATQLVHEVEQRLKAKGCLKVNLLLFRDNEAARLLYERLGYTVMSPLVAMGKEL
jgi:ribosomal protein S18 acetylase RimI-like enzyme